MGCVVWLVRKKEGGGVGGLVALPDGPRPLSRQNRGGMPILVSGEASRWIQQRCSTTGGSGGGRVYCLGSADCVCEDILQVSSSTGGLTG